MSSCGIGFKSNRVIPDKLYETKTDFVFSDNVLNVLFKTSRTFKVLIKPVKIAWVP